MFSFSATSISGLSSFASCETVAFIQAWSDAEVALGNPSTQRHGSLGRRSSQFELSRQSPPATYNCYYSPDCYSIAGSISFSSIYSQSSLKRDSQTNLVEQYHADLRNARSNIAISPSTKRSAIYNKPLPPTPQINQRSHAGTPCQPPPPLSTPTPSPKEEDYLLTPNDILPADDAYFFHGKSACHPIQWFPPMQPPVMFDEYPNSYHLIDLPSPRIEEGTTRVRREDTKKGLKALRSLTNIRAKRDADGDTATRDGRRTVAMRFRSAGGKEN